MLGALLLSPFSGLSFVLREIAQAVDDTRDADRRATMAALQELHRLIERGEITEAEFEEREGCCSTGWMRCPAGARREDPHRWRRHPGQPTLCDLLDRLIETGVVARGSIVISVAGIELIYIELSLLVASVETAFGAAKPACRH